MEGREGDSEVTGGSRGADEAAGVEAEAIDGGSISEESFGVWKEIWPETQSTNGL